MDVVVDDWVEELQFSLSREPFFFLRVLLLSTKSITTGTESLDCWTSLEFIENSKSSCDFNPVTLCTSIKWFVNPCAKLQLNTQIGHWYIFWLQIETLATNSLELLESQITIFSWACVLLESRFLLNLVQTELWFGWTVFGSAVSLTCPFESGFLLGKTTFELWFCSTLWASCVKLPETWFMSNSLFLEFSFGSTLSMLLVESWFLLISNIFSFDLSFCYPSFKIIIWITIFTYWSIVWFGLLWITAIISLVLKWNWVSVFWRSPFWRTCWFTGTLITSFVNRFLGFVLRLKCI